MIPVVGSSFNFKLFNEKMQVRSQPPKLYLGIDLSITLELVTRVEQVYRMAFTY
jgi:hypothetical protein